MTLQASFILYGFPILMLVLTAVAGYAYSQIGALSLPIPQALALSTVLLPLATGISTQSIITMIRQASRDKKQLTLPLIAIIGVLLMYDTAIGTLALTHMLPPSALTCGLNDNWTKLYTAKDADRIRAIQDAFKCCGFKTVKDRAFPFGTGAPSTCAVDYKRSGSCLGPWRGAEQLTAGLLLLVAVTIFVVKVLALVSLLTRSSWTSSQWTRALLPNGNGIVEEEDEGDDQRAVVRRLIENSAGEAGYRDEPQANRTLEGATTGGIGNGNTARVQPSPLIDVDNEWRDERDDREIS